LITYEPPEAKQRATKPKKLKIIKSGWNKFNEKTSGTKTKTFLYHCWGRIIFTRLGMLLIFDLPIW